MRGKLHFAKTEVERLLGLNSEILTTFYALQNEIASIEKDLDDINDTVQLLPELAISGTVLMSEISSQLDERESAEKEAEILEAQKILDELAIEELDWIERIKTIILEDFPRALQTESDIDILSEQIPLILHRYLSQQQDSTLKKALSIPMKLLDDMLNRLGLSPNIILVVGQEFSVIRLRALNDEMNQYVVIMPISRYQDIFGWTRLGHEVGHILFKHIEDQIQTSLQPLIMDAIGPLLNPFWILKWCEETFCDAVMAEFFAGLAVMDLDTMMALERCLYVREKLEATAEILEEFLSDIGREPDEDIDREDESDENHDDDQVIDDCNISKLQGRSHGTHPFPLLRIKLMLDYLDKRLGENKNLKDLREKHQESIETQQNVWPYPWCDSDFQARVVEIVLDFIASTGIEKGQEILRVVIPAIMDGKSLDGFNSIDIVLGLSICYFQQFEPGAPDIGDKPDEVYRLLLEKYSVDP